MPAAANRHTDRRHIMVTGGVDFIGGVVVRRLLTNSESLVFNLDKMSQNSDLTSIEAQPQKPERQVLLRVDHTDAAACAEGVRLADPHLVKDLATVSHMDCAIGGLGAFIDSNAAGTYHLPRAVRADREALTTKRPNGFLFHHISTLEFSGSIGPTGCFSETAAYSTRSPCPAIKAASDLIVNTWHQIYGLPMMHTNHSNNYEPWQFPKKLISVAILKALAVKPIPFYGDRANVHYWLHVENHRDAMPLASTKGQLRPIYCVVGNGERTNKDVVKPICALLDKMRPNSTPHDRLTTAASDRAAHDRQYFADQTRISNESRWLQHHSRETDPEVTLARQSRLKGWGSPTSDQIVHKSG